MTQPQTNDSPNGQADASSNGDQQGSGLDTLIKDAQDLKSELKDLYTRTGRLVAGLKRYQKRSKLMRSTLSSLRQLRQIDV